MGGREQAEPRRTRSKDRPAAVELPEQRFRELDSYRVEREWKRYEGTPQRELLLELRVRFLREHPAPVGGDRLELGPGPGRFTPYLAAPGQRIILVDLSREALRQHRVRQTLPATGADYRIERVLGNGRRPPLRDGSFVGVSLLGNLLGFAGPHADELLEAAARLVAPGGLLTVELSAGDGEYSECLHRLPPSAAARLLRAPLRAVLARVARAGFVPTRTDPTGPGRFRRISIRSADTTLDPLGFQLEAAEAIAPALGGDPERTFACHSDPLAWGHLLELEERLGKVPARWKRATALMAAYRRSSPTIK
ncbi:MAG: class I SAM-dependent methyltransferase [Thermoplasmata archaeon]|nr:class I SAM-dependent methyltransferase [Thermoplasmata archaeon]